MAHATRWLLPALLAIGVGTQGAAGSQLLASGTATARASQEPTELVLIATLHADHLLNPAYSTTHFRALLDRISPDAVGIERLPDCQSL